MAEETTPQPPVAEKPVSAPTPPASGGDAPPEPKVLFYILSFVVGLFGIIFGIIYMTKDGEESKKFGKICLILGLIPMVLSCLCWIIGMVFGMVGSGLEATTY